MKCLTCTNPILGEKEFCSNCERKLNSDSYTVEYCPNCIKPICISQEKVRDNKYKEFKGKCPKCGHYSE